MSEQKEIQVNDTINVNEDVGKVIAIHKKKRKRSVLIEFENHSVAWFNCTKFKNKNHQNKEKPKNDINDDFKHVEIDETIIKKQAELKQYYESFENIDANDMNSASTAAEIKKAQEFTKSILEKKPSGNVNDKGTLCHIINNIFGGDQGCLFFDSSNGVNLQDSSKNLADITQDKPFVLKLESSKGLGNNESIKSKEDELKVAEVLNKAIENNQLHPMLDDIRERLAKTYNVEKERIEIKTVYAGTFNIVYTVKDLAKTVIDKVQNVAQKLKTQFKEFVSLKVHPLLYRPAFDISCFDTAGNKTFTTAEKLEVGPANAKKAYHQPVGWTRYGLKVLGKYSENTWLDPFGHPGNWYRAYHGTGRAQQIDFNSSGAYSDATYTSVDAMASIFTTEFRPAREAHYGPGVYCSPNPKFPPNGYVNTVPLQTEKGAKKFKCMLQVAVNPNGVNCANGDIWVVPDPKNIRPYGILIQEV